MHLSFIQILFRIQSSQNDLPPEGNLVAVGEVPLDVTINNLFLILQCPQASIASCCLKHAGVFISKFHEFFQCSSILNLE